MQTAAVQLYVIVATTIFSPLLLRDNTTVLEDDDQHHGNMGDLEEPQALRKTAFQRSCEEKSKLDMNVTGLDHTVCQLDQRVICLEQDQSDLEERTTWNKDWLVWDILSLVVMTIFQILWQNLSFSTAKIMGQDNKGGLHTRKPLNMNLDRKLLPLVHQRYFHNPNQEPHIQEFVEGFVDDLLGALRSSCDQETNMEVEDCIGVGSVYEGWGINKSPTCDFYVPFAPSEPCHFKPLLWCNPSVDIAHETEVCGKIKVEKITRAKSRCACGGTGLGEDMLCLLHDANETRVVSDAVDEPLCCKRTPYLAKDLVMEWFQISLKAWGHISHKYDFDLTSHNLGSPGALKIRLRARACIPFDITPVVWYEGTDAYFVPRPRNATQTRWPLSFRVYEKRLLAYFAGILPENPCHIPRVQLALFLHTKQTKLTGKCRVTKRHFQTALLHLLADKPSVCWSEEHLADRLHDRLSSLAQNLNEKKLPHLFVGNPLIPPDIAIPAAFTAATPINLFHQFASQPEEHAKTLEHLGELIKNRPILIQECCGHIVNSTPHTLQGSS